MNKVYVSLLVFFTSCASYKYTYKITLEAPIKSNRLYFENDTLSVAFSIDNKGLNFDLYNKLPDDGIRINWDEVSLSYNGQAKRIIHKETGITKLTDLQPPTTIPPRTNLSDFIVSTEDVFFTNNQGKRLMTIKEIYPTYDYGSKKKRAYILKLKGYRISLFFPYYIRNVYHSKTFEFIISDIIAKKG